jgi:predicted DNA-binding transcriptional regulator AlpA
MTAPALLTPKDAAAFLQLSEKTLEKWRSKGTGPKFRRMGHRTVRYSQDDLLNWPGMASTSNTQEVLQ